MNDISIDYYSLNETIYALFLHAWSLLQLKYTYPFDFVIEDAYTGDSFERNIRRFRVIVKVDCPWTPQHFGVDKDGKEFRAAIFSIARIDDLPTPEQVAAYVERTLVDHRHVHTSGQKIEEIHIPLKSYWNDRPANHV